MNNSKLNNFFGFLGVVLLAVSLPLTVYVLKTENLDFRISAFESEDPRHILVTDIGNNSFRVTWITEREVYGGVKLVNTESPTVESAETSYHSVLIRNLSPGTEYFFQLVSGAQVFDQVISVKTTSYGNNATNRWVLGQVFDKDGTSTQKGGIVTLKLKVNNIQSQTLSSVINETGGFKFNIGSILSSDMLSNYPWSQVCNAELTIYTEFDQEPVSKTFTMDLSKETQIPNVYLGDINIDIIPGVQGN